MTPEEQNLHKQLADFARFPEMNPGPVCRFDKTGKVLLANKAARNLFGEKNLLGKQWLDICPGMNNRLWKDILATVEPLAIEADFGGMCIMFSYILPEERDFVFAFGTDISDRRKAEREVAEIARFPDMNPAPVLRFDLDGCILLANSAALNVFGTDLLGKSWKEVCPDVNDPNIWNEILSATDHPFYIETRINAGEFLFGHRRDSKSNQLFAFGADISENKRNERALRQTEKMATLGTLAAGVAHELNNPAAATRRAAEQLRDAFTNLEKVQLQLDSFSFSDEERTILTAIEDQAREKSQHPVDLDPMTRSDNEAEVEDWLDEQGIDNAWELAPALAAQGLTTKNISDYVGMFNEEKIGIVLHLAASLFPVYTLLNEIKQGSARISEIVGALKGYSYLGQAPVQLLDIHEGIDNTLVILRNKLKKGVKVHRQYDTTIPHINAYGSELNQVWTNIIDNAVDAMAGSGEITIRTSASDGHVMVEIEDNGPGIPDEIQNRIFDPFFTTKEPGKGTGLGLSTSYSIIVEKHSGTMSVESKPGKTKFRFALPIDPPKKST